MVPICSTNHVIDSNAILTVHAKTEPRLIINNIAYMLSTGTSKSNSNTISNHVERDNRKERDLKVNRYYVTTGKVTMRL